MRKPAKPLIKFYREISLEHGEIARRLQAELEISANRLAELAIVALAEAHKAREESAT
jgi:hypothetical protein